MSQRRRKVRKVDPVTPPGPASSSDTSAPNAPTSRFGEPVPSDFSGDGDGDLSLAEMVTFERGLQLLGTNPQFVKKVRNRIGVEEYGGAAALLDSPEQTGNDSILSFGSVSAVVRGVAHKGTRFNFQVTDFSCPSDDEEVSVDSVSFKISDGLHCVRATCFPECAIYIRRSQPNLSIVQARAQFQHGAGRVVLRGVDVMENGGDNSAVIGNSVQAISRPVPVARNHLTGQPVVSFECDGHGPDHPDFAYLPPCQCRGECNVAPVTEDGEGGFEASISGLANGVCVVTAEGIPNFEKDGVHNAPRNPDHAIEDRESNRCKRYALYYYCATNWYGVSGHGNRVVLPPCIVTAIRHKYPNPRGMAYGDEDYVQVRTVHSTIFTCIVCLLVCFLFCSFVLVKNIKLTSQKLNIMSQSHILFTFSHV
jgi:hypothetical protein